jgi:hypothetical protein
MSDTNDGGSAFPCINPKHDGNWNKEPIIQGMTLRDWFAGQALAGLMASNFNEESAKTLALLSYEQADEMINERTNKKKQP